TPVHQIQGGVERPGHPGRAATVLPTVTTPGFVSLFTRTGDRPELPCLAAGSHVKRDQISAMSRIAAGDADDHLVLDRQWRSSDIAAALLQGLDVYFPHLTAGLLVKGHYAVIQRAHEHASGPHGHAAVLRTVDHADLARILVKI